MPVRSLRQGPDLQGLGTLESVVWRFGLWFSCYDFAGKDLRAFIVSYLKIGQWCLP